MEQNPFAPEFKELPQSMPVFPLGSALLLPNGHLPLNIFEPRYLQMVQDAMATNRIIGMIQPVNAEASGEKPALQSVGCAGKIIEFSETPDGRYLITLCGLYRFKIAQELATPKLYRIVKPDWADFEKDALAYIGLGIDREKLKALLRPYFEHQGMDCDWAAIDSAPEGKLMTCLSMICPFESQDKQALLEAQDCKKRASLFMGMLEMAVSCSKTEASQKRH